MTEIDAAQLETDGVQTTRAVELQCFDQAGSQYFHQTWIRDQSAAPEELLLLLPDMSHFGCVQDAVPPLVWCRFHGYSLHQLGR